MTSFNTSMWHLLARTIGWTGYIKTPPTREVEGPVTKEEALHEELKGKLGCGRPPQESPSERMPTDLSILENNWEWMLSTAEEAMAHQEKQRAEEIRKELQKINRVSTSVKQRPRIGTFMKELYRSFPRETLIILEESRLDASKRDRILRDAVREVSAGWLTEILLRLPEEKRDSFSGRWHEQAYKKNICGEIVSLGLHSSHPATEKGLTSTILSDILWSIHLCLSREISSEVDRPLTDDELDFLTTKAVDLAHGIVDLWERTAISVGSIASREGRLPTLWEKQRKLEEERFQQLRQSGAIAARYNDGPADILQRQCQNKHQVIDAGTFADRKNLLSASLMMSRPTPLKKTGKN